MITISNYSRTKNIDRKEKGFTLIELLVVIAIIGILSSVVITSLGTTRIKAQDSSRVSFISQLERALELYYADNGQYPPYRLHTANGGDMAGLRDSLIQYVPSLNFVNPLYGPQDGGNGSTILYKATLGDNYQSYGLAVILLSQNDLEGADGGYWSTYFERGSMPSYCRNKYAGNPDGDWWSVSSTVCHGGN